MSETIPATNDAVLSRLSASPPRASAFLVTIYGDAVEPRGGSVWMGTLIACCADHGISESLVRTAVSRLVSAGRLVGERVGRRSYYRLSEAAQAEFRAASRILFAPPPPPERWLTAIASDAPAEGWPDGWARLSAQVALAPERDDLARPEAVILSGREVAGQGALPDLAAQHWPLTEVAAAYRDFLSGYSRIRTGTEDSRAALTLRLRLVHDYRLAALADPRLPRAAWPPDWPAEAARRVFLQSYLDLTERADTHVGESFRDADGPLRAAPPPVVRRLERLRAEWAGLRKSIT